MFNHTIPISASSNFTQALTKDKNLELKTAIVVIYVNKNIKLDIYRESFSLPNKYSRESYSEINGKFSKRIKDKKKYDQPPYPPKNAREYNLSPGIKGWSMHALTDDDLKKIKMKVINLFKK